MSKPTPPYATIPGEYLNWLWPMCTVRGPFGSAVGRAPRVMRILGSPIMVLNNWEFTKAGSITSVIAMLKFVKRPDTCILG